MASNDDLLEELRANTSILLRQTRAGEEADAALIESVCKDFIQLDISLLDGGSAPGAWGASKLSKSKM